MVRLRLLGWCAAAFVLAATASAQDLGKTITFKSNAMTADALLAALGKEVGVPLTASDDVRKDVLAVRLAGVTANEALQRIAATLSAQWTREGAGYKLVRDASAEQRVRQAELARRTALWRTALAPANTPAGAADAPSDRLKEVLQLVDPALFAALGPGERMVLSPTPTRMQRRLSTKAARALSDVLATFPGFPAAPEEYRPGAPPPRAAGPRVGYLVATASADGFVATVGLEIVSPNGMMQANNTMVGPGVAQAALPLHVEANAGEKPIALSERAKDAVEWFRAINPPLPASYTSGPGMFVALSEAAPSSPSAAVVGERRDVVLNPEANEPLGAIPSEALMAVAEAGKTNMIAYLPDSALPASARLFASGPKTPSQVLANAKAVWGLTVEQGGGWMVVKPANLVECWDNRVDRQALGRALRAFATLGALPVDEQANYAANSPDVPRSNGIDAVYFRLLQPTGGPRTLYGLYGMQRDVLRFWGNLTVGQRRSLVAGERMALGRLGVPARKAVASLVFNSPDGPAFAMTLSRGNPVGRPIVAGPGFGALERTDAFPDGVPRDGFVTVRVNREPAVLAFTSPQSFGQVVTARQLGLLRAQAEGGGFGGRPTPSYTSFLPGTASSLLFQFFLAPNVSMSRFVQGMELTAGASATDYDGLPGDFRDAVDAAYRQFFENAKMRLPSGYVPARPGRAVP